MGEVDIRMKFLDEEVIIVRATDPSDNCGYHWHVRLVSQEGNELVWPREKAEELRKQILELQ